MKKIVLSALCALATLSATAQGTVNFANVGGGVNAPVSGPDGLLGAGFTATLWAGASADSLSAVATAPFLANGLFSGGSVSIDGVAPGTAGFFQVSAANDDGSLSGMSSVFSVVTGGAGNPPSTPAALAGLESFTVSGDVPPIPEPSTVALAVLGGAALLLRRRK